MQLLFKLEYYEGGAELKLRFLILINQWNSFIPSTNRFYVLDCNRYAMIKNWERFIKIPSTNSFEENLNL